MLPDMKRKELNAVSRYLCNCQKCTNKYYRQNADGTTDEWCRPTVDGESPLIVEGDCGKNFVIRCESYTTAPGPKPEYPTKA